MHRSLPVRAFLRVAACAGLVAVLAPAVPAQVFDFDNVVMLANRDLFDGYNDVWAFVGTDGHEYVIQGLTTGTAWWDIDDPVNPVLVKYIPGPFSTWRDMAVQGNHAYVGTEGGGGIQVVDISDPTDPTIVNTYTATVDNVHNLKAHPTRPLLCVVGGYGGGMVNGGMNILDISNPANPVEVGRWDNQYIHDISFEGNIVHACLINSDRFRMIDITDSTNPVNFGAGWLDPTGSVHASWPVGDGVHVMIAEETGGGHVKCLDRSAPSAIALVSAFNPNPAASVHNVHVQGTQCWASWYAYGTRIIDVSNPASLTELGYWDTYPDSNAGGVGPGNWGVYPHLPSGVVAANDGKYGLFLLKYQPDAGRLEGTVSSSAGGLLPGALVEYDGLNLEQTVAAAAAYKFSVFHGSGHLLRASAYGHAPDSATVSVGPDGVTVTDFVLTRYPSGGISGTITEAGSGNPIAGVEVTLVGTPFATVTDANGDYAFPDVPTVPSPSYALDLVRYAYQPRTGLAVSVVASTNQTYDYSLTPGAHYEDFSAPAGWSVQSDASTTSGFWVFAEPFGTYSNGLYNPELDHTLDPEDQCAVTGNASSFNIGTDDVDGGATRLLSPVYDLTGMAVPHVFYYRWYAVNDALDAWQVHVSDDGGSSWTLLESTTAHENYWQPIDIDLTPHLGALDQVRFRFTAEDPDPGQVVEGALDDFTLYDASPGATGAGTFAPRLRLDLAQNRPNPFPGATTIDFAIPAQEAVRLSVFDVRGARVATLVDGVLEAGAHRVEWDGQDMGRRRAAAGVYFYRLETKDELRTRKMVRID